MKTTQRISVSGPVEEARSLLIEMANALLRADRVVCYYSKEQDKQTLNAKGLRRAIPVFFTTRSDYITVEEL